MVCDLISGHKNDSGSLLALGNDSIITNVVEMERKPDFDNGKIGAKTHSLKL